MTRKGPCEPAYVSAVTLPSIGDIAGHAPVPSHPAAAPHSAKGPPLDGFEGYRFDDLKARRIVTDRADLSRKIRKQDFPPPVKLGDARQAGAWWPKHEVHAWIEQRAAKRNWPHQHTASEGVGKAAPLHHRRSA